MMPESAVHPRKSIHDRATPQREQSDSEEYSPDDSLGPMTSISGSETEASKESVCYKRSYTIQDHFEISRSVSRTPQRTKSIPVKTSPIKNCTQDSKNRSLLPIIAVIILLITVYLSFSNESEYKICSFEILKKQYPKENAQLWSHLKVGIELVLNVRTQKPAVYLFAHYGGQHAFHLIKDIASHASHCFGKKLIPMDSDDFISATDTLDDYGYAIEKYRTKIKEGNVILIANLNEIPAEAARAFHTICDTHSPIAKNAVIFLTLTIQYDKKGNANALAEETLIELWGSKLGRNELDPLITRVTDEVIILQS